MQIVDFSNLDYLNIQPQNNLDLITTDSPKSISHDQRKNDDLLLIENIKYIERIYPDKIQFSIKEIAKILTVSYELIRKRIEKGTIRSINVGDRRLIHKETLIQLLTKGVL